MYRHPLRSARSILPVTARNSPAAARTSLLSRTERSFSRSTRQAKEADDFKGQLYESTRQRLQREREAQKRFAQGQEQSPGYKYVATTTAFLVTALTCYYFGRVSVGTDENKEFRSTFPLEDAPYKLDHDVSTTNLQAAWADFVEILGEDNVSTDNLSREGHADSDWSSYKPKEGEKAFLVVYPSTTEEVSKIMKICHQRKIPVVGFSGGTSLEGHFAATRGGVCVDFGRMNRIVGLHKEDMDIVVQPAVHWEELNEILSKNNLFFPPDPGPGAMIGGMVATGCSGTNAYHYGTMRDWVLSLTVVLADGTVIKTKQRPRKSSAGYDLTKLFIGSEGTLGLITEATLKLAVKPKNENVAVVSFPSVRDAATCVSKIVGEGIKLAGVEILDDVQMHVVNASGSTSRQWEEAPTLFLKFTGTDIGVKEQVSLVQKLAKATSSKSFQFAKNAGEVQELWSARKQALWSAVAMKEKPDDRVWTTDVAVPISKLPDIIEQTRKDIAEQGILAPIVGHVGDGNFHTIVVFNKEQQKVVEGVVHRMVKRAVEMEGTVTGEHGVGLVKRDYLPHEIGEPAVDTMRKLKFALDPLCLLNPDKVIRVEQPKPGEVKEW